MRPGEQEGAKGIYESWWKGYEPETEFLWENLGEDAPDREYALKLAGAAYPHIAQAIANDVLRLIETIPLASGYTDRTAGAFYLDLRSELRRLAADFEPPVPQERKP